jgi:hypothetical protein
LTVNGTTTTLDTELTSVDKLEVDANNTTVAAAITQRGSGDILNLYDGATEVVSVLDGGAVRIGGNAVSGAAAGVVLQDGTGVIATRSSGSSPVFRGYTQGDNSANFTVKADGKLLLGTETEGDNSADNLTIADSGNSGITIRSGTSNQGSIFFSDATSGSGEYDGFIQYSQNDQWLKFGTATSTRLTITSTGNIGIGSVIPAQTLDIMSANPVIRLTDTDPSGVYSQIDGAGGDLILSADGGAGSSSSFISLRVDGTDANAEKLRITSDGAIAVGSASQMGSNYARISIDCQGRDVLTDVTDITKYGLAFHNDPNTNDANGIGFFNDDGTSCGGYILHQDKGSNNLGDLIFGTSATSNNPIERLRITSGGNVGINQVSPAAPLSFATAAGQKIELYNSGSNNEFGFGIQSSEMRICTGASSVITFYTNGYSGNERLRITSAGKIGIGHQQEGQITKELTIRPANDGGIRFVRPGASGASVMSHLELTTTTSGSVFPSGEAYTVKYNTINNDQIFTTYAGGGTGGNISFQTGTSGGNETEKLRITSDGTIHVNSPDSASGGRIYATGSKLYLQSGNGRQSFNITDMASGQSATHEFNSSGSLVLAGSASAKNSVTLTDTDTSARLNVHTDLSGNYTGWKERNVASGSMSQASIDSKTPTLNDFTYPNNSNGMLIWSTSKIGFAAGGESPQYGTGVQMVFDSGALMLGGLRAFDRTTSSSTTTNWNIKLNTAGSAQFKGQLEADPFLLDGNDSWIKSIYGGISNSTVSSLNNLMIGQNMRGWIGTRDGGSPTNNFYHVTTHNGIGYCGTEYCYEGITKFYNNTGGSTANATFTPKERVRLTSSRFTSASGFHFSTNSSTNNSLPNPYNIGNVSSNNVAYPHDPGMYLITASSPCDNTWRTLLTSINDSAFVFEGISGDASSKRSYKVIGNPTSPGYGVNRMSEDYNHGAWNTGDIEFRLDGSHPNWNLQVKTTSYYNSSNTANIKFMLFVYY